MVQGVLVQPIKSDKVILFHRIEAYLDWKFEIRMKFGKIRWN